MKICKPSSKSLDGDNAEERTSYAKIINHILEGNENCSEFIPVNTLDE